MLRINGVVVTWVVAMGNFYTYDVFDPPGVQFPLDAST